MTLSKAQEAVNQFTRFGIIGVCNGALDLLALNLLLWIWHGHTVLELTLINTFAYGLAVLNSYYWNSRITFKNEASYSTKEKIKFFAQAAVSLVISNLVFVISARMLGHYAIPSWIIDNTSKGLSMLLSSTCSFFFMRYLVYK
ncbi:GtrA family protein [Paenibacillus sepulcri]|uniref:GtrA family protein n=1 Tax=Paenibacillus sepulcri TaxID=359917 RepID=A0ABS7BZS1_9BACL|nr:GtrA family protein [Paenibacillus sepulcri]